MLDKAYLYYLSPVIYGIRDLAKYCIRQPARCKSRATQERANVHVVCYLITWLFFYIPSKIF